MRQIDKTQLSSITGAGTMTENFAVAGALGGGVAASSMIKEAGGLKLIPMPMRLAVGSAGGLAIYASFETGRAIGNALYSNDTIATKVLDFFDWLTGK